MKRGWVFALFLPAFLTFLLVTASPALAAPSYSNQMAEVNREINATWMGQFLYNRDHRSSNGLSYLDWSSDRCSAPLGLGDTWWDFHKACWRHDFGYRNLKRIENTFHQDAWRYRNKANVDTQFGRDMRDRCGEWNFWVRGACQSTAGIYENAVRLGGGGFPTVGAYYYSMSW